MAYQPGDVFMFGTEPTGLPQDVLAHPRVTERVRLPMVAGRRSMNLANCAAVAVYEAWRQNGFAGGGQGTKLGSPAVRVFVTVLATTPARPGIFESKAMV